MKLVLHVFCILISLLLVVFTASKLLGENKYTCNTRYQRVSMNSGQYVDRLIKKLLVFGSSSTIMDFLRSGSAVRLELLPYIPQVFSRIRWPASIQGMALYSREGEVLYKIGADGLHVVSVEFCYINSTLNRQSGICSGELVLYMNIVKLTEAVENENIQEYCRQPGGLPFLEYYEDEFLKLQSNIRLNL